VVDDTNERYAVDEKLKVGCSVSGEAIFVVPIEAWKCRYCNLGVAADKSANERRTVKPVRAPARRVPKPRRAATR